MKNENKNNPSVEFNNTENNGDLIKALVFYFSDYITGEFVLEMALKKLKELNLKVEENRNEILKGLF